VARRLLIANQTDERQSGVNGQTASSARVSAAGG
jgi:hypothetical protein